MFEWKILQFCVEIGRLPLFTDNFYFLLLLFVEFGKCDEIAKRFDSI